MAQLASLRVVVRGRVTGVFFRASVERRAERLGLTGYVRNAPGGAVEVVAEGPKESLKELVDYLRVGPPAARVDDVDTESGEYRGRYTDFSVRY
jgi:acylphosphatase